MARRNRREPPADRRPLGEGIQRYEEHPDGDWIVRRLSGARSTKPYRCPGCDQLVAPGTPHVVAWPADGPDAESHRRHWHTPCWAARDRRRPRS